MSYKDERVDALKDAHKLFEETAKKYRQACTKGGLVPVTWEHDSILCQIEENQRKIEAKIGALLVQP